MKRLFLSLIAVFLLFFVTQVTMSENSAKAKLIITIDGQNPANSFGLLISNNKQHQFALASGRNGTLPEGSYFKDGFSLLGDFRVSGVLSSNRFEMAPDIIKMSVKPADYLKNHLFANMNSIDFDDDGIAGEYGQAYIGLTPVDSSPQPFTFGEFKEKYRWYNYAVHGTNDEGRIGKKSTGGCINIANDALQILLGELQLGDLVTIQEK